MTTTGTAVEGGKIRTVNGVAINANPKPVTEVINAANQITGNKIQFEYDKRRAGDAEKLVSNVDKLYESIKWKPNFDNLDLIIQTSIDWEKKL